MQHIRLFRSGPVGPICLVLAIGLSGLMVGFAGASSPKAVHCGVADRPKLPRGERDALTQRCATTPPTTAAAETTAVVPSHVLQARVVAVGLAGVYGVRQVGLFHAGGPIPSNPDFLMKTRRGRVLDPERVLVATESNFGSPLADNSLAPGAILSIDTRTTSTLRVPAQFAAAGGQAEALGGQVRLYSAQADAFLNRVHNPRARTATRPAVAGPRYISINNAFGRPWFASTPFRTAGVGMVSVTDPNGAPLDNPPDSRAGGVFLGASTNREQMTVGRANTPLMRLANYRDSGQLTPGALSQGALGMAFLGASPDGSGFAVFAAVTADGAVVQVHVQDGVDGLAPAGTAARAGDADPGLIGMAFKWNPDRALYLTDAPRNRLAVLELRDDARQFKLQRVSYLTNPQFSQPVDLAAAVPEIANPRFASHTTLAGGSDLYVANRGDGSLLRVDQAGQTLARAVIQVPGLGALGADRIRALAVSGDGQRLWLTLEGVLPGFEDAPGALIEVSAFGASGSYEKAPLWAPLDAPSQAISAGHLAFTKQFTPAEGLGPLFNARSCVACHNAPTVGGMSVQQDKFAVRVARMDAATGRVENLDEPNSPVARRHSVRELGVADAPPAELPRKANVTSLRMPQSLYDSGLLDDIPDAVILAHAVSKGDGIKGRPNRVSSAKGEPQIGRYGWKAAVATLEEQVANAFANEMGITSSLDAEKPSTKPEDDGTLVRTVAAYLRSLEKPSKTP